jgi:hypothetical protein
VIAIPFGQVVIMYSLKPIFLIIYDVLGTVKHLSNIIIHFRFSNVVSKWPGSTHDSFIIGQSALWNHLEAHADGSWLLGDSGYPLKRWLMTPLANPQTPQEHHYNKKHCKTRNTIERAFGLLKSHFRCLHKTGGSLQFQPTKSALIIMCCFKLHNFALARGLPVEVLDIPNDDRFNIFEEDAPGPAAQMRQRLINSF